MKKIFYIITGGLLLSAIMFGQTYTQTSCSSKDFWNPTYLNYTFMIVNDTNDRINLKMVDAGRSGTFGFGDKAAKNCFDIAPHTRVPESITWKLKLPNRNDCNYAGFTLNGMSCANNTLNYLKFTSSPVEKNAKHLNHTLTYNEKEFYRYGQYSLNLNNQYIIITPTATLDEGHHHK